MGAPERGPGCCSAGRWRVQHAGGWSSPKIPGSGELDEAEHVSAATAGGEGGLSEAVGWSSRNPIPRFSGLL